MAMGIGERNGGQEIMQVEKVRACRLCDLSQPAAGLPEALGIGDAQRFEEFDIHGNHH
jgi:hypothetical protein